MSSTTGRQSVCFLVCEHCDTGSLVESLIRGIRERNRADCRVVVKRAPCLSACRFKQVVKVLDGDGNILRRYSSVAQNGFQALGNDPVTQLLDENDHAGVSPARASSSRRKAG